MDNILNNYNKDDITVLVGTYPPPIGGVSVHIKRLYSLLKRNGYNSFIWDTSTNKYFNILQFSAFFLLALIFNNVVFHVQTTSFKIMKLVLYIKKKTKSGIYFTNHNLWFLENLTVKEKELFGEFISNVDKLFVINNKIIEQYSKLKLLIPNETIVISPYIRPDQSKEGQILKKYHESIFGFLKKYDYTILVSAYKIVFKDDIDLYGLDLSFRLLEKLSEEKHSVGLIVALADSSQNHDYLKGLLQDCNFQERIYIFDGQKELWPLFRKVDIFLRPTYTDGYGVSVAEAIDLGCKVIASDVCDRTKGTILFENRNFEDLYIKVKKIINQSGKNEN